MSSMRLIAHMGARRRTPRVSVLLATVFALCLQSTELASPALAFSSAGFLSGVVRGRFAVRNANPRGFVSQPHQLPLLLGGCSRKSLSLRMSKEEDLMDVCGDGGCRKQILEEGVGQERPEKGDVVQLEYHISIDGQLIDSSQGPFEFELGLEPSDAIKCWEKALPTMRKQETAVVTCGPSYAFGETGAPPKIPPNATLECELKLLSWVNQGQERERLAETYTPSDAPEEDIYDGYKQSIETEPAQTAQDLNVTATNPKPPEIFKLDDPRVRAMTSRQQRVDGKGKGYRWHETEEMIDIYVQVPVGTSARSVACDVGGQTLSVALKGGEPLLSGRLHGGVYASESVWGLTDDEKEPAVHISLRKKPADQRIWATVLAMASPDSA